MSLFGCEYQGGRAASAPQIRAGTGTSKGEMLRLEAQGVLTIEWDGRRFPAVEHEGEPVAEALPQRPGILPHMHEDMEERFPKAKACEALADDDPIEHGGLEARGVQIGRQKSMKERGGHKDPRPKKHD